ncbi:hypothetical protein ECG_01714 [Echinococcus granulosus]|uniref:Expressed conserved protein n=1 Tax=Echinococcus granulosus TaxID=6210 RepID=A0A068WCF2_ECHGR|nr:hypothetical protein ECG_01714 [Echinococcus granulosus]CDS15341.1 expressed conserved protein [Echinococcus granulosus]
MDVDEFNRKTRELCLSRRRVFKGTTLDQLYNRYLSLRSLLPFRPGCCSDVCPGCYRNLSHSDRICRVRALKQKRDKISTDQIRETFACRFCRVRTSTRTAMSRTIPVPGLKPIAPSEILALSPFSTFSVKNSRKKKRKKNDLMEEVRLQQPSVKKAKNDRSSLKDFLNLIS